ncbi:MULTISPECIES: hypothetical protein [Sphingobacterium]|uniref:Uncharacterized protein n=1 Tax=Sphingobacterium tenebrionis TaxID=3111775 RepID=A0ABU8I5F0_9SPHI|nr:hypothetical protein [Sphingobacterium sp. 1.A.4]
MYWKHFILLASIVFLWSGCKQTLEELEPLEEKKAGFRKVNSLKDDFLVQPILVQIQTIANGNYPGLHTSQFLRDLGFFQDGYCHPDVQYFPNGFRGYKFWMVFTPYFGSVGYDFYARRYENPTVVVSNDGINWVEPEGISNPIQKTASFKESFLEKKGELVQGFWSDVDWMFRNNRFELYYRGSFIKATALKKRGVNNQNNRHKLMENALRTIVRQTSVDGINWEPLEVIYTSNAPATSKDNHILSPSFVDVDGNIKSYEVEFNKTQNRFKSDDLTLVINRSSLNGLDFSNYRASKAVNFLNEPWLTLNPNNSVWHLDVTYQDGYYFMLLAVGDVKKYTSDLLYLAYSKDGINFLVEGAPIVKERAYRSTIFAMDKNNHHIEFGLILGSKVGQFKFAKIKVDTEKIEDAF